MAQKKRSSDGESKFFEIHIQILRVEQVADMLGYSKWHIYRLVNQNKIPFKKRGKTLFFIQREILDWLNH